MKNAIYLILLFGFFFALYSCGFGGWGEWKVSELYNQKIEGTSKILYKYDAWGGRDSHVSDFVILDSTEKFKVKPSENLPFTYLQEIPDKIFIKGVSHICDNSCGENYYKTSPIFIPIKEENSEKQSIKIANNIYQYRGFSERSKGLERFQFEKFREIRDSLFFYNLDDVESMEGKHLDSLKFKKTDIVIKQNKEQQITQIVIEDLIIGNSSNEIILKQSYFLTPKNKLKSNVFSDYGVFKEVIK